MGRWWMFAGDNAADHFRRRATGQRSIVRGGDLFRGRSAALRRIHESVVVPTETPLVITGQPGAGKSTVLARAALAQRQRATISGLAFHARGQGIGDLVRAVARVAAIPSQFTWLELVDHLTDRLDVHLAVFIDALDEMATEQDLAEAVRFIRELSSLAGVSVAVASRWRAPSGGRRARDLPSQLGAVAGGRRDTLVDLDSDRYFAPNDLLFYAEAMLCQEGTKRPGPQGAAWEEYRRDRNLRRRLAEAIARRAGRNYLVSAMAAFQLSESEESVDHRRSDFDERRDLPGTVGEALDKYLNRLPVERRERIAPLLVALAYAEGAGLTDSRWRAFTEALGYVRPLQEDLDALRSSGAADYLLQTITGGTERTTRLFHQALDDHLREDRDTRYDQRRLATSLVAELPEGDWSQASDYVQRHGPTHLAAGGLLDDYLTDVRFLLAAHPERLIPALSAVTSLGARQVAHVYELAFHQLTTKPAAERAAYLQLAARCAGTDTLAMSLTNAVRGSPWSVAWAQCCAAHTHRVLGRHRGGVWSVAVGELDGCGVVVSGGADGTVRIWGLDGGELRGEPWRGHHGRVYAVAVGELADRQLVISAGEDGTVRVWQLDGGAPVGEPRCGHQGAVKAVAVGEVDGRPMIVSGGEDGTVRVWELEGSRPFGEPWIGHNGEVEAVAVGRLHNRPVVVSGGVDGALRVWELKGGAPIGQPWSSHQGQVNAVAVGEYDGSPVVISGGGDGTVRVWRLDGGRPVGDPWRGHSRWVDTVAVGEVGGSLIVVSGGYDGTVRIWRLHGTGAHPEPWRGHDWVNAVAVREVKGSPVAVSGGRDGTVRVWRLDGSAPLGDAVRGHEGWVNAVALAELEGCPVVVSGGEDGTVRVWQLDGGAPVGEPWCGHDGRVDAVTVVQLEGGAVVASSGEDGTVRMWQLDGGIPLGEPFRGHEADVVGKHRQLAKDVWSLMAGDLQGRPVVVSGGHDATLRVWPLDGGASVGKLLGNHMGDVWSVAVTDLKGRPVVISGGDDATVRVWRLDDGTPVGEPWRGHEGFVRAVAVSVLDGHPVVVSGGEDGTVRMWRLDEGVPLGEPWCEDGRVRAVATGTLAGHPVVASGSWIGTVRVWRPGQKAALHAIDLGYAVRALAFAGSGQLVVGTSMGLVVLHLSGLVV